MKIRLGHISFTFTNFLEFLFIYKDVFLFGDYRFSTTKKSPYIIDCGAHIGIPILYFKSIYPSATILAFEPNPMTFQLLQTNVENNRLRKVKINNYALASNEGSMPFYIHRKGWNWGDAGVKNSWYSAKKYKTIRITSKKLSSFITRFVDLLKIDIEGMEVIVLKDLSLKNKLHFVKEIIIEFHGCKSNKKNSLNALLNILKNNKFNYTIRYPSSLLHPFRKDLLLSEIPKRDPLFLIVHACKI